MPVVAVSWMINAQTYLTSLLAICYLAHCRTSELASSLHLVHLVDLEFRLLVTPQKFDHLTSTYVPDCSFDFIRC